MAAPAIEEAAVHLLGEKVELDRLPAFFYDQDYAKLVDDATLNSFKFEDESLPLSDTDVPES